MGKGDVTMKFDAQTAAFLQNVKKAHDAIDATAAKNRELGNSADKAGSSFGDLGSIGAKNMASLQSSLMGAVGGFNLVQMGLSQLTSMYDRWRDKIKEVHEANIRLNESAARAASSMGSAGAGFGIRRQLENMNMPGVQLEQKMDMVRQAKELMPTAGKEQIMAIVQSAGQGNIAGKDPTELLGTMARMSKIYKNANPDQLRDKSSIVSERMGGMDDVVMNAVLRAQAMGGDADELIGRAIAYHQAGGSLQTFARMLDKTSNLKVEKVHGQTAKERQAVRDRNELAKLPLMDRVKRIEGSRDGMSLLGDDLAAEAFSNSKVAASQMFKPDDETRRMANAGGSFNASAQAQAFGDKNYTKDLASAVMAEDARTGKLRNGGPQREFNDIESYLKKKGNSAGIIEQMMGETKAGVWMSGKSPLDVLKSLSSADASDFIIDRAGAMDKVRGTNDADVLSAKQREVLAETPNIYDSKNIYKGDPFSGGANQEKTAVEVLIKLSEQLERQHDEQLDAMNKSSSMNKDSTLRSGKPGDR